MSSLILNSLLLALVWGPADVAAADAKDCCQAQLACCSQGEACCAATVKLGCCAQGQKCCAQDQGCCKAVQPCCSEGSSCCDQVKACCGKADQSADTATVAGAHCPRVTGEVAARQSSCNTPSARCSKGDKKVAARP